MVDSFIFWRLSHAMMRQGKSSRVNLAYRYLLLRVQVLNLCWKVDRHNGTNRDEEDIKRVNSKYTWIPKVLY